MRILQISSAKTFGGGERHLVDLCRELDLRGHEVFVALRPTNEWQDRLDFLPRERFMHVSIRNSFGTFSTRRIARFIDEHQIDLVHAHIGRDYLVASIACRVARGTKLVLTRHVMMPLKPFHRFALRNVNAVIAVSPAVRGQLERVFPAGRVTVIANGVAARVLSNEERIIKRDEFRSFHAIPQDAPLIAAIGELKVGKGQRDFVLAANEVLRRIPDCRFVIAGKDNSIDQKFRRELKRLVRVLGHEDQFLWLGWLDDVLPLMAAADVFVSASHSESFGLGTLEAMATGTPVIATETDGAKLLIPRHEYLVPIKDPVALAAKIVWLLEGGGPVQEVGQEFQSAAIESFSLKGMIDATEKLYGDVLYR
jgi:L-malate glycosyltransferase